VASLIPQETLDEILQRIDIASLIGDYLVLKKAGKDFKGLCPFHQEKTPSFMVSPSKGIFHCFGCAEGGNAFKFLMKLENLTFPEAAQKLAQRVGIILKTEEGISSQHKEKDIFYKINRYAAWYFAEIFKTSQGRQASTYLAKRDISPETIQKFMLGSSTDAWDGLSQFLKSKNVPLEAALKLGLVRARKDGSSTYDFFRHRLMFPIIDSEGRVLGFSGRRLNDSKENEEPKYINSAESPIYHKGSVVYGLFQAKEALRKTRELILVEGNVDVIRLHQEGLTNAVAPLGTALTQMQVQFLARFVDRFILMFDGDAAGFKAFMRALPILLAEGHHPRVVMLPPGEDPDSFVRRHGSAAMTKLVSEAPMAMDWLVIHHLSQGGTTPSQKAEQVEKIIPFIDQLSSTVERQAYKTKLAHFLGSNSDFLSTLKRSENPSRTRGFSKVEKQEKISLERILFGLYVTYPQLIDDTLNEDVFQNIEDGFIRDLFQKSVTFYRSGAGLSWKQLLSDAADDKARILSGLALSDLFDVPENEVLQMVQDCLYRMKIQRLKGHLQTLTGEIHLAEIKKDPQLLNQLLSQKTEVVRTLKSLGEPTAV